MLNQFQAYLTENELVPKGSKTLIAVSGGVDSVVLCHLFFLAKLPFAIAHCNFQLRGAESDLDEAHVEAVSKHYQVDFFSIRFDTRQFAKTQKLSIQEAARKLRYDWLGEIREKSGCQLLATAHHLDDSIETFLYNFSKGCGIRGLHGIAMKNGPVIRPLLFATKKQIADFATNSGLGFREDASNNSDKYNRNKLRHHVVPVLELINPKLQETAKSSFEHIKEAEQLMDFAIRQIEEAVIEKHPNEWHINIEKLRSYPSPKTVLYEILKPFGFNDSHVDQILESKSHQSGRTFHAPPYLLVVDRFFLILSLGENIEGVINFIELTNSRLQLPGGGELTITIHSSSPSPIPSEKETAWLDFERLKLPLNLRHWQPGDVFQPFGMNGKHQKLQDFFSNNKLSLLQKERVWLLESGGEIAWVVGMRLDERFKITEQTKKAVRIEFSCPTQ